ncbi:hypothetical protein BN1708_020226, partial [Verticillium longisporum]
LCWLGRLLRLHRWRCYLCQGRCTPGCQLGSLHCRPSDQGRRRVGLDQCRHLPQHRLWQDVHPDLHRSHQHVAGVPWCGGQWMERLHIWRRRRRAQA